MRRVSVLDVTPILLACLGVPLSREFDGEVPEGLLESSRLAGLRWVDGYPFPPVALADGTEAAAPEDEAMLEQLRGLGYIE